MKQSSQTSSAQSQTTEKVLTIPRSVYSALHPIDQMAAQALEKVGKVRIVDEEERDTVH
ncbi:MAG: hypothetical protein ABR887_00765 [Methanoregulaceae archaeon]|jgi:hypothetical protein